MQGRILCIEDNIVNRERLKYFLNSLNYHTLEASTGRDGITTAYRELPNLILLDTSLPDVDCLQVIKSLKSTPELRHIPVVLLTLKIEDWVTCQKAGCNGYILKPFGKMQLEETLQLFLGHQATA